MNILVTGANGQLGHEMQICAKNSNHKFVFTDVAEGYEKLDITNLDAIREKVKENDIQVIVNCAAYTTWIRRRAISISPTCSTIRQQATWLRR